MDHVISNLKALLLNPGSEIGRTADDHASPHSTWVDGTTLKCFDRPSDQPSTAKAVGKQAKSTSDPRASKTVAVEDLVGFFLSYMKDCAEDYLTRRPIKPVNVIDGSQVETKMQYTHSPPVTAPESTANNANTATSTVPIVGKRAEVTRVVMGVPVNCTERCKRSLKNAAQLAGFTEVSMVACSLLLV